MDKNIKTILKNIRCLILDVDGVMTDSTLYMSDSGQEYKAFNSKDGHGMRMLQDNGVDICIITGRTSTVVKNRAEELGIRFVFQGRRDKLPAYEELLQNGGYKAENLAYMGDDVVDLPVMIRTALPVCVADAHPLVKQHSKIICQNKGGKGAVRELCELILDAQGKLQPLFDSYLAR